MKTVNIHEAKTHLSRLIQDAVAGEEIVIAKAGTPLVKIVALSAHPGPRQLGALAGAVTESADWWAPDPEIEALFYGTEEESCAGRRVAEQGPRK
jgi:prevent-host-death family protein